MSGRQKKIIDPCQDCGTPRKESRISNKDNIPRCPSCSQKSLWKSKKYRDNITSHLTYSHLSECQVKDLTDIQAAWLGAMVEAEGSLYISPKSKSDCRVSVCNTDVEIISAFLRIVGTGGIVMNKGTNRPVWVWNLSRARNTIKFLEQIRPYMAGKGSKADKILSQLKEVIATSNRRS